MVKYKGNQSNHPLKLFNYLNTMKHITEKLELDYPCQWLYKIIAMDEKSLLRAIKEIFDDTKYVLSHSNTSSSGKYISYNLELTVHSEESRNFFYLALKEHPAIKMVI